MDVADVFLSGQSLAVNAGLVEILAVEQHFRTAVPHRSYLKGVGGFGYDDGRRNAKKLRGIGHRLPVVTGRSGDNATRSLIV